MEATRIGFCFFATAFIYVDRIAPTDVRHSAQTVFGIIILGVGPVMGGWFLDTISGSLPHDTWPIDYRGLWMVLSLIGLATALFGFSESVVVAAFMIGVVGFLSAWNMSLNRGLLQLQEKLSPCRESDKER